MLYSQEAIVTSIPEQPILDWINSAHYILEESNFNIGTYVRLCDLDIPREKWLNHMYVQTVDTLTSEQGFYHVLVPTVQGF